MLGHRLLLRLVGVHRERGGAVVRVQVKRVGAGGGEDAVDLADELAHEGGEELVRLLRHEQQVAVLLRRALEPHRDVGRGREVGRVDLLLRAERALDRPAHVQPAAQPHRVAGQPLLQSRVLHELREGRRAAHADREPDEGRHRQVTHRRRPLVAHGELELVVDEDRADLLVAVGVLHLRDPPLELVARPRHEEGVADVLVGEAAAVVHGVVHDVADRVGEEHHLLLQALRRVGELANVAEAEEAVHLDAHGDRVDVARRAQTARDRLLAREPDADLQQRGDLADGLLELVQLVQRVVLEVAELGHWVLGKGVDEREELLDGCDAVLVGDSVEDHHAADEQHQDEGEQSERVLRLDHQVAPLEEGADRALRHAEATRARLRHRVLFRAHVGRLQQRVGEENRTVVSLKVGE
mmetsp:Transcript_21153/g.53580  ORF Transcript_21153/g.53580 Transcript_21153/m.53580 type:complete len:411 (-) Transcript_21153:355-1587(-)